jgi:hypothetical protein
MYQKSRKDAAAGFFQANKEAARMQATLLAGLWQGTPVGSERSTPRAAVGYEAIRSYDELHRRSFEPNVHSFGSGTSLAQVAPPPFPAHGALGVCGV